MFLKNIAELKYDLSQVDSEYSKPLVSSHLVTSCDLIGVNMVAFVCHHNSLLIYGALKKPTMDRFSTVTHFSTGLSLVACLIMALAGDLVFKDKTMGNILNNFPSDIGIVNLARFCFGFNCFTTLPLELFV
jgi:sodium-coupled neutral amino acid transporter 11